MEPFDYPVDESSPDVIAFRSDLAAVFPEATFTLAKTLSNNVYEAMCGDLQVIRVKYWTGAVAYTVAFDDPSETAIGLAVATARLASGSGGGVLHALEAAGWKRGTT